MGWLTAAVVLVTLSLLVFAGGLRGSAVAVTVVDDAVVGWLAGLDVPGLLPAMRGLAALGSWTAMNVWLWGLLLALLIFRRLRHLVVVLLLDAGADPNLPWTRWDVGRRPLALAARCGHLAAYELLASRGAVADLDGVDAAVLAVARGESVRLPAAPPPAKGLPAGDDYGWILGQFASLGQTDVVRALLDSGMPGRQPWLEQLHAAGPGRHARTHRHRAAAHRPRRRPARLRLR